MPEVGIGDEGVFDNFCDTGVKLVGREVKEEGGVGEDFEGEVEGADGVFSGREVDGGFTSDGAIDHGEEGSWNLDIGNAA